MPKNTRYHTGMFRHIYLFTIKPSGQAQEALFCNGLQTLSSLTAKYNQCIIPYV